MGLSQGLGRRHRVGDLGIPLDQCDQQEERYEEQRRRGDRQPSLLAKHAREPAPGELGDRSEDRRAAGVHALVGAQRQPSQRAVGYFCSLGVQREGLEVLLHQRHDGVDDVVRGTDAFHERPGAHLTVGLMSTAANVTVNELRGVGLAHIVKKGPVHHEQPLIGVNTRLLTDAGRLIHHHEGVHPDVALWMPLRVLLAGVECSEFWKILQPATIHQKLQALANMDPL